MTSYTQRRHGVFHKKRRLTKRFKHTIRKSQRRVMRGGMKGTKNYEDGRRYDGDMKDGEANGTGKMTWPDGKLYVGEWKNSKIDGTGKMTWPSGQVYVGEWKDSKRQGRGKIRFSNGIIYEGNWNNDSIQSLTFLLEDRYVSKIAFHPTEPLLLSVCGEETDTQPPTLFLQRFNQNTGVILDNIRLSEVKRKGNGNGDTDESTIEIHHSSTIAFHPKKPIFAVGNNVIGEVCLFEWEINERSILSAKISSKTKTHPELIAFHPNQPLFATHGQAADVPSTGIWRISDASPYQLTDLNCEIITTKLASIAFHPTQPILMTASSSESDNDDENYVILWNYFNYNPTNETPNMITILSRIPSEPSEPDHLSIRAFNSDSRTFHTDFVTFVAFHPSDSSLFATCSKDAIIKIWRMALPPVPTKPSYDKDGKELQITREDVMNATCMATCIPPKEYESPVTCVAFHPTALLLVGGYSNGIAMLWELEAIVRKKVVDTKPLDYQEYGMAVFPPPDIGRSDAYSSSKQAIVSSVNFQVDSLGVTFLEIGRSNTIVVELQNVSHYVSDIKNREKRIFLDRKDVIKEISRQFMSPPELRNPLAQPRQGTSKFTGIDVERAIQRLPLPPRGGDTVVFDPDWRRTLESRSQQGQISKDELDTEKEASKNWREKWEEANRLLQIRRQKEGELPSKGGNTRRTKRKNLRK